MSKASLELGGGNWGTKDGNLLAYAQGNESSKFIPREFTFTRGSDIAATRINSSGLIEKYRENLLLQSNQFDTSWTTLNASVTSGQSGYDGSSDAWELEVTANGTNNRIIQSFSQTGIVTFSVYAKASSTNFIYFYHNGTGARVYFDLQNGTFGNAFLNIDSKIEAVSGASGWYRCSMTINATSSSQIWIIPNNALGNASTDLGNSIFIQDTQAEIGLISTEYIESGATTATSGVADNEPRINYAGGTASLLLEPSRTNLVEQSEYFGGYSNSNSTDEPNATISPERLTNATSFLEAATTGQHKLFTSLTFNGSSTYTFSIFAKSNGRDLYIDTQNSNEWGGRAWFDLTAGTANAVLGTVDIEDYGNGWYRCIVTGASTLAGGNFIELLTSNGSSNSTTGDITKGVYIYGAQLEIGSYATSYIPTYGTSVTRNGENTQLDTSSLGITDEFTVFIDTNGALVDGTSLNEMGDIRWYTQTTNRYRFYKSSDLAYISNLIQVDDRTKIALKITASECKTFVDGVLNSTISLTTPFASFDSINRNTETKVKDDLNQISLFSTALTDKELVDLTSPYSTYQELVTAEGLTWESPTCTTNSITELQSI